MEKHKEIQRELKLLLDRAEEIGWIWNHVTNPNAGTYIEFNRKSPAGEVFFMDIYFDKNNQAISLVNKLGGIL